MLNCFFVRDGKSCHVTPLENPPALDYFSRRHEQKRVVLVTRPYNHFSISSLVEISSQKKRKCTFKPFVVDICVHLSVCVIGGAGLRKFCWYDKI